MSTPAILIIDDDPLILKALEQTLLREGYRILSASSGQRALANPFAHISRRTLPAAIQAATAHTGAVVNANPAMVSIWDWNNNI